MLRLQRLTAEGFDWGNKLILDGLLSAPLIAWAHVTRRSLGARLLTVRPLVRHVLQHLRLWTVFARTGDDHRRSHAAA